MWGFPYLFKYFIVISIVFFYFNKLSTQQNRFDTQKAKFIERPSGEWKDFFYSLNSDSLVCPCFSEKMLDSLLFINWGKAHWSDVPGCKLPPHHEMLELFISEMGGPKNDFNFSAQAGLIDGVPFASSCIYNNNLKRYEWRCEGFTTDSISKECTLVLKTFIEKLRLIKPELNFCGIGDNISVNNLHAHIPLPVWLDVKYLLLIGFLLISICSLIIVIFFRRKIETKNIILKEKTLLIEKHHALQAERSRIASEMHDDLGSGLTTIKYLSDKALTQAKDEGEKTEIKKIAQHSNNLLSNMGEIIWAMNSRFDNVDNLMGYIRRYSSEYLEQNDIELFFISNDMETNSIITGEKRRNVFLVIKEILHNAVKYSGARAIKICFDVKDKIVITISEIDGKGFEVEEMKNKSNGLYNMQKRMEGIGNIQFVRNVDGMVITLIL